MKKINVINEKNKIPAIAQIQSMSIPFFLSLLLLLLTSFHRIVLSCNQLERDSLLSFSISSSLPLNWSSSQFDCCKWPGISCTRARVTHLWLPKRHLSATINPSFFTNLPFLTHLNLSHNRFFGPFPFQSLQTLNHLQTLDLSFNSFSGPLLPLPISIQTLDLSSNRFNSSFGPSLLRHASNLIALNVSNNTFAGSIPSSTCNGSPLVEIFDFSMNLFTGPVSPGLGECRNLQVLRAGSNSLSGNLPDDIYSVRTLNEISLYSSEFSGVVKDSIVMLSNLTVLELNDNRLIGELPLNIGLLSKMERFILHTNGFNGTIPLSLMRSSNLKTLLLRNNRFVGVLSDLDFSKLRALRAIDLGNNSFSGNVPHGLCSCTSLVAVRLAYNELTGEIPPCMSSLASLSHLSLTNNNLSNVAGALKVLSHCKKLAVLLLARCSTTRRT